MKKSILSFLLTFLVIYGFSQQPNAIVRRCQVAPVIDGIIEGVWDSANVYNIALPFQTEVPTLGDPGETTWKALWDESGIYILLQITDDVFSPCFDGEGCYNWEFDSPELVFDCNYELVDGNGAYAAGHHYIIPWYKADKLSGGVQNGTNGVLYAHMISDPNALWEFFVPWTFLVDRDGNYFIKSNPMGFDAKVVDNDTPGVTGRSRAVWANDGNGPSATESWNNMDDCGTLSFEGADQFVMATSLTINAPATTIDLNDGTLQFSPDILPVNATVKTVKWEVEQVTGRAMIDDEGLLTSLTNGIVKVVASTRDGSNLREEFLVTINNQMVTLDEANLIKNGHFTNDENGFPKYWGGWLDGTGQSISVKNGQVVCSTNQFMEAWHFQLHQIGNDNGWELHNDTSYIVMFTAWADKERSARLVFEDQYNNFNRFGSSGDPESIYGRSEWEFGLNTIPQTFTFGVTMDQLESNSQFKIAFQLSQDTGNVFLDDVYLIPKGDWDKIPIFKLELGPDKIITCGDNFEIIPKISYNGTEGLSYSWSPIEGLSSASIKNPVVYVKENRKYFLSVSSEDMGLLQDSIEIIVNQLEVHCVEFQPDSLICGNKFRMGMPFTNSNGTATYTYSWSPTIGLDNPEIPQPEVEFFEDRVYNLEITSENNCIAADSIRITVKPLEASIEDIQVECGRSTELIVTSNYVGPDNLIYNWEPSSNLSALDIKNPLATVTEPTRFSVAVSTNNGCVAIADAFVSPQRITDNPQICMVSVGANNRNIVLWSKPESQAIDSFLIYRESIYQSGLYELIGKLEFSAPSFFMDSSSNALVQSNRYKIAYKDICGFQTDLSPEHKTMHLNINMGMGNAWNLIWEEYEGFIVGSYRIYRGTNRDNLSMIGSTSGGNTSYTDFSAPAGDVFYQIEVITPSLCGSLKSDAYASSWSNISTNTSPSEIAGVVENGEPSVYPNPASDIIYFRFISPQSRNISIYNLQGMEVLNGFITEKGIDISTLSKGIYIVKVLCPNNVYVEKIIKE